MKKVRLNLKRGTKQWGFVLYDSCESAFYLKDKPFDPLYEDESYRRYVTLKPGEMIEVEWLGAEWVYEEDLDSAMKREDFKSSHHEKYDKVRLGKLIPIKHSSPVIEQTAVLEIYSGWVAQDTLPWSGDPSRKGVRITPLIGKMQSKMDFSKIFAHHKPEDDEDEGDLPKELSEDLN